jgi:hypothetical protein
MPGRDAVLFAAMTHVNSLQIVTRSQNKPSSAQQDGSARHYRRWIAIPGTSMRRDSHQASLFDTE